MNFKTALFQVLIIVVGITLANIVSPKVEELVG